MKRKRINLFYILLVLTFFSSTTTAFAEGTDPGTYNLETAIRIGINNSILLQQLDNKVTLSRLKVDAYDEIGDDLLDGRRDLGNGDSALSSGLSTIDSSQDSLNQAKIDILNGIYPQGSPERTIIPNVVILKGGDNIVDTLNIAKQYVPTLDVEHTAAEITKQVNIGLETKQKELNKGKVSYEKNQLTLIEGKIDYKVAKANIAAALADKLDISELNGLTTSDEASLLYKLADASAKITVASKDIYKNQIALLIQNSYYNVLKAKKMVEIKASAIERVESQYQFAEDSYEAGMKAKDDVLLAKIYYTGTKLEHQKAVDDYENALIELKKNMGIPMEQSVSLEDVPVDNVIAMDLDNGLKNGLNDRLEIIKATQQAEVYKLNQGLVQSDYNKKTNQYTEAEYLRKNADLELEKVKKEVESSIRQSYNTMMTMGSLLDTAKDMVSEAKECVDIAQDRYKEGFGADSSLLKKLNLEASAGTILEVISAEENLAQVEEKYVEILYGYNLSKAKYLNDTGYLTY